MLKFARSTASEMQRRKELTLKTLNFAEIQILSCTHGMFGWQSLPNHCPKAERRQICTNRAELLGYGGITARTLKALEKLWDITGGFNPLNDRLHTSTQFNYFGEPC